MTTTPVPLALATDLLTGAEWGPARIRELFQLAADIKSRPSHYRGALNGRFLALILEKPSLRTRVTFQVGMESMGGSAVLLDHTITRLGERESIPDVARNLSRWVQGIVARVFEQSELEQLAEYASIPVINALSDLYHPCQGYADFFTLEERFGSLRGLKLAYIGDGNNVCHSLLLTGARVGAEVRVATPPGYEPQAAIVAEARAAARETHSKIELFTSAADAVRGPKRSTRTSGPAWDRSRKPRHARKYSPPIKSHPRCLSWLRPARYFFTACPLTARVKSPVRSLIRLARWCLSRPKIGCMSRKPSC